MKVSYSGRSALPTALFGIVLITLFTAMGGSAAAQVPLHYAPQSASTIGEYATDARLLAHVTLRAVSRPLAEVISAIGEPTGVLLSIKPNLAQRNVTIIASRVSARQVMTAIARATDFAWSDSDPTDPARAAHNGLPAGYELYQTDQAHARESASIRASEQRERALREAQHDAMMAAIERTAAGNGVVSSLLQGLSDKEKEQIADTASQPTGVISASNQAHFQNHLVAVQSFGSLSADIQANVSAAVGRPEFAGGANSFAPALSDMNDLSTSKVGLIAADNGISLGIVGPDGKDVWVSPTDTIHASQVPDGDVDGESAGAELLQAIASTSEQTLVNLDNLPKSLRTITLRFPASLDRTLTGILTSISEQSGIPIVSDAYVYGNQTTYYTLLTDRNDYTFRQALDQVARAFGREFFVEDGILCTKTLLPGLNIRAEPPADLLARLRDLATRKQLPDLTDYLTMGTLTDIQVEMLAERHISGVQQGLATIGAQRLHPLLHFLGGLSAADRGKAASLSGLPVGSLTPHQQHEFALLAKKGMPARLKPGEQFDGPRLLMRNSDSASNGSSVTFLIVGRGRPGAVTSAVLPVQNTPPAGIK